MDRTNLLPALLGLAPLALCALAGAQQAGESFSVPGVWPARDVRVLRDGVPGARTALAAPGALAAEQRGADSGPDEGASAPQFTAGGAPTALRWREEDGALWVRGADYKASFDAEGATFVPFLGSDEERNWPLHMALVGAAIGGDELAVGAEGVAREGTRVRLERGAVDEVYEVRLGALEQTFVVDEPLAAGDLKLRVRLASELAARADQEGWLWTNAKGEGLRYGRAFLRLADGGKQQLPAELDAGGLLTIVVPQALVAQAGLPLVVDPVVSAFAVDNSAFDNYDSDVVWLPTVGSGDWQFVYEERFSATDSDVYARRFTAAGALMDEGYIALGTAESWAKPRIAYNRAGDRVLCTAEVRVLSQPDTIVRCSSKPASGAIWSTPLTLGVAPGVSMRAPDVGGDPFVAPPSNFLVAWEQNGDIRGRTVDSNGVAGPYTFDIGVGPVAQSDVSVSNSNQENAWGLAWRTDSGQPGVAVVSWDAASVVAGTMASVSLAPMVGTKPQIAALGTGEFAIAWLESSPTSPSYTMWCWMRPDLTCVSAGGVYGPCVGGSNCTFTELSIDADDCSFAIALRGETPSFGAWIKQDSAYTGSALDDRGSPVTSPALTVDAVYGALRGQPRVATKYSSYKSSFVRREACITWTNTLSAANRDVQAATTSWSYAPAARTYCHQGSAYTAPCPCGDGTSYYSGCPNSAGQGAELDVTGESWLGVDTARLSVTGLPANTSCLVFQGTAIAMTGSNDGAVFGDGLRCVAGSVTRIGTGVSSLGALAFPPVGGPGLAARGGLTASCTRYYQVWYRNAAAFCSASTFNLTNGLRLCWTP